MKKLCREIHPEVKVLDAAKGLVRYIASDETLDHYREIILANGWRFDHFRKNAPFVDSHDYACIDRLLGRVTDYRVEGRQLIEEVQWAIDTSSTLAKLGFDLTEKGYLKAVSVGFIPSRAVTRGSDEFAKVATEAGLTTDQAARCRTIYQEHQQIELSACIIGANPNALAKAFHDGAIGEAQMHALGLDNDDALRFLDSAAKVWDTPACDEVMRAMIGLELRRCYHSRSPQSDSSAGKRQGAPESRPDAQAEMRREFLRKLEAATLRIPEPA